MDQSDTSPAYLPSNDPTLVEKNAATPKEGDLRLPMQDVPQTDLEDDLQPCPDHMQPSTDFEPSASSMNRGLLANMDGELAMKSKKNLSASEERAFEITTKEKFTMDTKKNLATDFDESSAPKSNEDLMTNGGQGEKISLDTMFTEEVGCRTKQTLSKTEDKSSSLDCEDHSTPQTNEQSKESSDTMGTSMQSWERKMEEKQTRFQKSLGNILDEKLDRLVEGPLAESMKQHRLSTEGALRQTMSEEFKRFENELAPLQHLDSLKRSKAQLQRRQREKESANNKLVEQLRNKDIALGKARRERQEARKEAKNLVTDHEDANEAWEVRYEQITTNLHDAEARAHEAEAEKQRATQELQLVKRDLVKIQRAQKTYGDSSKTSDADIVSTWHQLSYNIRNLAARLAQNTPARGYLGGYRTETKFLRIISRARLLLKERDARPVLLQAYLWRAAEQYIQPEDQAQVDIAQKFEELRYRMLTSAPPDEAPSVAAWFADGWKAMNSGFEKTRNSPYVAASEEAKLLLEFIPGEPKDTRAIRRLEDELADIFQMTQQLNITMGTSKAIFKRSHASCVANFDGQTMAEESYGKKSTTCSKVSFSISPSVIKYGNADGQNHGSHMTLIKSRVVLGQ